MHTREIQRPVTKWWWGLCNQAVNEYYVCNCGWRWCHSKNLFRMLRGRRSRWFNCRSTSLRLLLYCLQINCAEEMSSVLFRLLRKGDTFDPNRFKHFPIIPTPRGPGWILLRYFPDILIGTLNFNSGSSWNGTSRCNPRSYKGSGWDRFWRSCNIDTVFFESFFMADTSLLFNPFHSSWTPPNYGSPHGYM